MKISKKEKKKLHSLSNNNYHFIKLLQRISFQNKLLTTSHNILTKKKKIKKTNFKVCFLKSIKSIL